ncbi:unnamed protein product [Cyclocybe aegerita]|uniref:Endonuclease/exonuclease/phosphatase domain-containing protein n=1 Tax=Cyclocybe aegerita TaxID=1973307 RepID=A0A8S0WE48_CYCAE|nr:unnamed protein product [Cyclocybe aegerita]
MSSLPVGSVVSFVHQLSKPPWTVKTLMDSSHKNSRPSPEQIALIQKARLEKRRKAVEAPIPPTILVLRPWLTLDRDGSSRNASHRVKILSWNLLAQCLIRRELFPTSDCLKAGQREPMIHEEIIRQDAQILCLQEVDRLEKLLPKFEKAGYTYCYASGPRKKHGCLIAYKKDLYSCVSERVVFYDDQSVDGDAEDKTRIGNSFKTRNIASLVALTRNGGGGEEGLIIGTTHLFWHPRYTYERIRQLGIMIREVTAFREKLSAAHWPCVLAGDFNFTPSDPAYSLAVGDDLLPEQEQIIHPSRVVHSSLDPSVLLNLPATPKGTDEDDAEAVDPDRVITNARPAKPEDGLLTVPEIVAWFRQLPRLRSAYSDGIAAARGHGYDLPTFGIRAQPPIGRRGSEEPEYTSYTYYWKSVLDYIFFIDPPTISGSITGLLAPLTTAELDPGIPKLGVSGSDHTVLAAELNW